MRSAVTPALVVVGHQPLEHKVLSNFFRLTFTCQPVLKTAHVDFIVDEIDRLGRDIVFP
jgi:hypothetical protein